jgi:hypothetical protein
MVCLDCRKEFEDLKILLKQAERAAEKAEIKRAVERDARAAGVLDVAMEDVLARAVDGAEWGTDSRGRVRRMVGGLPEVDENGEYLSPSRWLKSVRPSNPHWFGDTDVAAGNVSGPNPWAKNSWNMTEQGQLVLSNPAKAKKLAADAGVTLDV